LAVADDGIKTKILSNMSDWLGLAMTPSVIRRAVRYAIGVGLLLIAINHGDAIVRGDVTLGRGLRMLLTVIVPYCVSTASSVGALRDLSRAHRSWR
jgi:hypothetical protein